MTSAFTDSGQTLANFVETIYVRCPKCNKRAHVIRIPDDEEEILAETSSRQGSPSFRRSFSPRKLSCLHCGYTSIWQGNGLRRDGPYDWYFQLPLWLQTPCCGDILWAFNEEHLSFLERYVTAKQRIKYYAEGQIRNGTMASRLPTWMKSAKNRDQVLKGISRLKEMVENS